MNPTGVPFLRDKSSILHQALPHSEQSKIQGRLGSIPHLTITMSLLVNQLDGSVGEEFPKNGREAKHLVVMWEPHISPARVTIPARLLKRDIITNIYSFAQAGPSGTLFHAQNISPVDSSGFHYFIVNQKIIGQPRLGLRVIPALPTPGRVQLPAATVLNRGLFIGEPHWGSFSQGQKFYTPSSTSAFRKT